MVVLQIVYYALMILWLLFIARIVFDLVQAFSPRWRPQGFMLVVAEAIYTPTDPPLRALRKVIPPLSLGGLRLDLAFLVVMLVLVILMQIVQGLMRPGV